MKSRGGKWRTGVDIKNNGGQVIAPPSIHPDSGKAYRWKDITVPALLIPEDLLNSILASESPRRLVAVGGINAAVATQSNDSELYTRNYTDVATPYGNAALRSEIEKLEEAPQGERNEQLNLTSFALGQLVSGGELPEQQVRDAIAAAAEVAFHGEDRPNEIPDTLESGLTAGMNNPRSAARVTGDEPWWTGEFNTVFVPAVMGRTIKDEGRVRLGQDGRLYKWEVGVYHPNGDNYVVARAADLLGERYKQHHVAEVKAWMKATYADIGTQQPSLTTLNVGNGLLNWETGQLDAHTPTFLSTAQIPVAWDPYATCPVVNQFLADILPDDAMDFVLEIIGYALYAGNPFAKAVQLLGPGGNGKSKLLHLIRSLVGPKNVSSVPLQAFSDDKFAVAGLFEKLANICGDLDARTIKRTDAFKKLTGGDEIHAQHKFLHPFEFTCYALPIFSANEPPLTSDQTDAWFDRWLIVPLERRFRGTGDDDPFIGDKITTKSELEGLLVLAVNGLRNLIARGGFDLPASVTDAMAGYRERLDTVRGFVAEECEQDVAASAERGALYRAYKRWCDGGGRYALGVAQFNTHLRGMGFPEARDRAGRHWRGLKLLNQLNQPEQPWDPPIR